MWLLAGAFSYQMGLLFLDTQYSVAKIFEPDLGPSASSCNGFDGVHM